MLTFGWLCSTRQCRVHILSKTKIELYSTSDAVHINWDYNSSEFLSIVLGILGILVSAFLGESRLKEDIVSDGLLSFLAS